MKWGLGTAFVLLCLISSPTAVQSQEQPAKKPNDVRQELLELKQVLLDAVARLEKVEEQLARKEQGQNGADGAEATQGRHTVKPKDGYVPNAQTAIAVAVAIWSPIYGADKIKKERPYSAHLSQGIWIVQGSLPKEMAGGVAVIEISKDDGRILRVSHGK